MAPRTGDLRDAGVIYHAYEFSKVWPKGIENQVQEGDTGDLNWCESNGLTWMRPDDQDAPQGHGLPGLLPENGGLLREIGFKYEYIGRFPEPDNYEGWNDVDTSSKPATGRPISCLPFPMMGFRRIQPAETEYHGGFFHSIGWVTIE